MKRSVWTLVILIVLTLISALLSRNSEAFVVIAIILIAALKFVGVSFYFMELKQANSFWKGSVLFFLVFFISAVLIIFHN